MRIVTWNCCAGTERDLPAVRALGADVAVLCEVAKDPPPASLLETEPSWAWDGDITTRGLAVAGFTEEVTPVNAISRSGRWSIATRLSSGLGVLGIWACPPKGETYSRQVVATIEAHASWLRTTPAVVAGDFNLAPFGVEDSKTGVLRQVFEMLAELGYTSVYHHATGEAYGAETTPTYFQHRRRDEGFHIDYCFVHHDLLQGVKGFEVGSYDDWVARRDDAAGHSDHVPLVLDLDV